MNWDPALKVRVGIRFGDETLPVGTLARTGRNVHFEHDGPLARFDFDSHFEYDPDFIQRGIEISPVRLPLKAGPISIDRFVFDGLPGVFADSLPDGWGRLLQDKSAEKHKVNKSEITPLDRLCHVGNHGMGALVYEPIRSEPPPPGRLDVDDLAFHADNTLAGRADDAIEILRQINGSSCGARPKALIGLKSDNEEVVSNSDPLPPGYEPYLVKFQNSADGPDAGAVEYVYSLMARKAGLPFPQTLLIPSTLGPGHFAVKRFDRVDGRRLHMHTASGALHSPHNHHALDYKALVNLTLNLTRDAREAERMYRMAVFNVFAHNRDDHGKNFSFLMDSGGAWALAPAYDLTFSIGPNGHHSTAVMGEGKRPGREHLLRLAIAAGVQERKAKEILDQTRSALAEFKELAAEHGVDKKRIESIAARMAAAERDAGRQGAGRG